MNNGFVASNGAQIHYKISGEGAPLVLLHGNGENTHYFDPQIRFFSQYYKVIAIDSRSYGQSTRGDGPLNFIVMANDVTAVLDGLKIEKAHILGFSDGGNIAIHLALLAPERILSLILAGANLSPKGMTFMSQLITRINYIRLYIQSLFSLPAQLAKERWALMVYHPQLSPEAIAGLNLPALVIAGEKDMIREKHTRSIANALPDATLYIMLNTGHFIPSDKPELFNAIVARFLAKLSNKTAKR